jgi:hypothetical protein
MPTNTISVIFTPGLKIGFFGPNGSFHHGIIAGLAMLPQVSGILYVYFYCWVLTQGHTGQRRLI